MYLQDLQQVDMEQRLRYTGQSIPRSNMNKALRVFEIPA